MAIRAKTLITLTRERQVTTVRNFYKATSTNTKPSAVSSSSISAWTSQGWLTAEPAYNASTPYVWLCMQTLFGEYNATTNPNNYINSEVSLSSSYTAAINANILAESIATNTASFWTRYTDTHDKNDSTIPILAGAYASSNPQVDYLDTSTFGYNSYFGANALTFRYKTLNLAKYATNGVQIYKVATGTTYKLSTDVTVDNSKTYYTYSNNVFTKVTSPSGNPSVNNYYEAVATLSQSNPVIELTYDIIDINGTPSIKNRLTFYDPETNYRSMELRDSELAFYLPNTGATKAASLTSTGLKLSKGGIESGNLSSGNGYVYLSTEDKAGITINGHTPGNNDPAWRQIIGSNFGVDSEGNLYASNANISGAITATSLTISDGNSTYSGISAINANGYTIEIINDADAKPSGTTLSSNQTYLYPIMRRNGEVVNYLLTSDTTPESGKSYYIRTYDSSTQTYTYTLVSNPSGNPQAQSYYEAIDKTLYIWTYNNIQPGVHGDSHLGGIVATYNRTYRVSYALSDDEVGQATSSQIIEVDPQKYITQINEYGIKIHPETWTNQSSYIQLDGTGMEVFDSSGISIAKYGSTARIGKLNNSRFLVNSDSLQAYSDTDSSPYFEVSANGLSWGSNTAATTAEVSAAAQTASNYITTVGNNGIKLHPYNEENNYTLINSNGMYIYQEIDNVATEIAEFSSSGAVIGEVSKAHTTIDEDGMQVYSVDNDQLIQLANLGYGNSNNDNSSSINDGVTNAPYYTFGRRRINGKKSLVIYADTVPTEYDSTQTYKIGDCCIHENKIFICRTQISTPKAWSNSDWSYYIGAYSFAEGYKIIVSGRYAHAEGSGTIAIGSNSHAEGQDTMASGTCSHAEGLATAASGIYAHAEGNSSEARGKWSHAEGRETFANGDYSHTQNIGTIANKRGQTVIGVNNSPDHGTTTTHMSGEVEYGTYVFMIGNGGGGIRSNALTVAWNGNTTIAGTLTQSSDRRLKTHQSYLSTDAINFIQNLKPVYFKKDNQSHVGFYAQDVEKIDPWNCMIGEMNGYKTLGYTEIIAPLVTYCQHLEERIRQLEEK